MAFPQVECIRSVREQERTLIAREIHDEFGQALVALDMDLQWMIQHISQDWHALSERARSMLQLVETMVQSVQCITSGLRLDELDEFGLVPAIMHYIQKFQERTGIECKVSIACDEIRLNVDCATAVLRILQEALTNCARHAGANLVAVRLAAHGDQLVMNVTDNGKSISEPALSSTNSFGLRGMRERATAFGGTIDIKGLAGSGTVVSLRLPIHYMVDCREQSLPCRDAGRQADA